MWLVQSQISGYNVFKDTRKDDKQMKKARFIAYIVLAATTLASCLMFIASIVLTCIDLAREDY